VTGKRITAILYGSDRNLWGGGPLRIRVSDIYAAGGPTLLYQGTTESSSVDLRLELPFDAGQVYGLTFSAPRHRPAWHLVRRADFIDIPANVERDDLILRLMLVPDAFGTTDLPAGPARLEQIASPFVGDNGFDAARLQTLAAAAQMAFFNIEAKLRETIIDGAPLMSFVRGVQEVAVDRVFVLFAADLKTRMPRAVEFAGAPGHGSPEAFPELPAHPDSWKHTKYAEGNIQLCFSRDARPLNAGSTALVHSADVDIDLGKGLAHAQEWLVNNVFRPGHKTNQALVYGMLFAQGIIPKYALDPVNATTRAAPRLRSAGPLATGRGLARGRRRRKPRPARSARRRRKSR
jgi:hypothetical protein